MFPRHSILSRMLSVFGLCALLLSSSFAAAPTTPAAFKATALAYNKVALSWVDSSSDETGFQVEIKVGAAAYTVLGFTQAANTTTEVLTGTTASTQYTFRIRAFNQTGAGGARLYSAAYRTTTAITTPTIATKFDDPSNFTGTSTASTITVNWQDNSAETGFELYGKLSSSGSFSFLGDYPANTTNSGAVTGLSPNTSYDFAVRAYKELTSAGGGTDTFFTGFPTVTVVTKDAITSGPLSGGFFGASVFHTFTNTNGSAVTSRTLTGVPPSMSFNAATGVVSGNLPTTIGGFSMTYTVNFANGWSQQQTAWMRVKLAPGAPALGTEVPDWAGNVGATRTTPLSGAFSDVEAESAVRVTTTSGAMDFILYDSITPATVTNFMNYVNAGDYTNVAFHRSVSNFVIQAGAFRGTGTGANFDKIPTDPPVINEPGLPNLRGTVSMAKLGGDPNSATNQFFVSLGDNRSNLDGQNGGFTVFGRVGSTSMPVADAIGALPRSTYELIVDGVPNSFEDFPVDAPFAPPTLDQTQTNLVKILSVAPIPVLQLTVTGNTNPSVATAAIVSGELQLSALTGGTTSITVTATDLDGQTTTQTVEVAITDTFATWSTRQTFPGGLSASGANPDGDGLSNLLEYAFLKDPAISDGALLPAVAQDGTSPAYLTISFPVRKFTTGLTYAVEGASSLDGPWTDVWKTADGFAHAQVLTATDAADHTDMTIRDTETISPTARRFLRVRTTEP